MIAFDYYILSLLVVCLVLGSVSWFFSREQRWPKDAQIGFRANPPQEKP